MPLKKKPKPGQVVIHRSLDDDKLGTAKRGVVESTVGDDDQSLVIARYDDHEEPLAFDDRELISVDKNSLNQGPMILKPRHLFAVLKKPRVLFSFFLVLIFSVLLNVGVHVGGWSIQTSIVLTGLFLLVLVVVFSRIERNINDSSS
jgi:hypothetical protein